MTESLLQIKLQACFNKWKIKPRTVISIDPVNSPKSVQHPSFCYLASDKLFYLKFSAPGNSNPDNCYIIVMPAQTGRFNIKICSYLCTFHLPKPSCTILLVRYPQIVLRKNAVKGKTRPGNIFFRTLFTIYHTDDFLYRRARFRCDLSRFDHLSARSTV